MGARSCRRVGTLIVVWLVLALAISWRLLHVQVIAAEEYRQAAAEQTERRLPLAPRRGRIADRQGQPLALSLEAASVYVDPRQLREAGEPVGPVAEQLAGLLDMDLGVLGRRLSADTGFTYLARQVDRRVGERIAALGLPGVGVLKEPLRVYPAGDLATPLLGLAGVDHQGLSGLERQHDELLSGQDGEVYFERAPNGVEISAAPRRLRDPQPGTDLVLTIDREVQAAAETALREALDETGAEAAAAVVQDARTGDLLALASVPTVAAGAPARNRAVTDVYEPGSVNKVITLAAALEEGLVEPHSTLQVPDTWAVADAEFSDTERHESVPMSVAEVMARSSNVGTIRIAERLGAPRLEAYVSRFGYGEQTGLAFPGESAGLVPALEDWSGTSLPTIAIGHGVSASLLQVNGVVGTIANGGVWTQPRLVRGHIQGDGEVSRVSAPDRRRVVSEPTADAVATMLTGVVHGEHGTGRAAAVPGYEVAGKTGTTRKVASGGLGYEPGAYIASFAGFAPADDPRLVVSVMVDEPQTTIWGGTVAAPVFAEIMSFALAADGVAPGSGAVSSPGDEGSGHGSPTSGGTA